MLLFSFFFFMQKTAYELRISDWSSDVCSSDLVMRFLALAGQGRGPRVVSVQNPYSLLNRSYETRLAEVSIREEVGLLAYAPLAAGTLTGKYLGGQWPQGARRTLWPGNRRYQGPQADKATAEIGRAHV